MSVEEIAHQEELAHTLQRRLRVLEAQRTYLGPEGAPAHLALEIEDIRHDLQQAQAALRHLRPAPSNERAPYLGLLTFQEQHTDLFFGRDALVDDLVTRVGQAPFVAVLGASGSGKSSVVRAGLIPLLKGGALPGSATWRYCILKPGARPLDTLAAELARLQGDPTAAVRFSASLTESDRALLLIASALLDRANSQRLVLVVDQFEELWTLAPAEAGQRAVWINQQQLPFIRLLLRAVDAPDSPLLLIITMRSDFLHRADDPRELAQAIGDHDLIVSPMSAEELRQAIVRPAQLVGGDFEPGLVDELQAQVVGRPGALPLLEYTLLELWKQRQPDGLMTWDAYRAVGGVEGALAARADTILAEHYTPAQQQELRQVLLRLVQPGEGAAETRRRVRVDDLVPAGDSPDALQALLKPLADERLLTIGHDSASGEDTVEISHEALIRAWPTFDHWIAQNREELRLQLQLEEAAQEWQQRGEAVDFLWSGLRLANTEAWIERNHPLLNEREQRFLTASRAAEQARKDKEAAERREREALLEAQAAAERRNVSRLRLFLIVVAILFVLSIGLAIYALYQRQVVSSALDQSMQARATAQMAAAHAEAAATQEAQARAEAQHQARVAETAAAQEALARADAQHQAQAAAAQASLAELANGNIDQAILLARETVLTDAQALSPIASHAIQQSVLKTVPDVVLHTGSSPVSTALWSPDGKYILTRSSENMTQIWDAAGAQFIMALPNQTGHDALVAWSPDGKKVITDANDDSAHIWDVASGKAVAILKDIMGTVRAVAWSPDGKHVVTGSDDNIARIWDAASGKVITLLKGHTGPLIAVAWSSDGKQVLTGANDNSARIWDATTGNQTAVLQGHTGRIYMVAWGRDGKHVLTASSDGSARIWDMVNGNSSTIRTGYVRSIMPIALSPDGNQVLTVSDKGMSTENTARIWDSTTGKEITTLQGHTDSINAVAWSPDGKQVLTGASDNTVRVWDAATGNSIATLMGHTNSVDTVAWSPDGKRLLTGSADGTARIWDVTGRHPFVVLEGHTDLVLAVAWDPDGKHLVTSSGDGTVQVWDATSGKTVAVLRGHKGYIYDVVWSPDGKQVLTGSSDHTARIWDLTSGQSLIIPAAHEEPVFAVGWSPDGKQVLTSSGENAVRIWDASSGKLVTTLEAPMATIGAVAWSPDGKQVLGAVNSKAQIWDVASGKIVQTLQGHTDTISTVAWSPNGDRVLTGNVDRTARIWDATTGKSIMILTGHTNIIRDVVWSPDGKQVLTGSADSTARIWDASSGTVVAVLEGHVDRVEAVAWSPDGRQVLTGSDDGTARIWIIDQHLLVAELTRRVCNVFTDDDIRQTIPSWRGCVAELAAVATDLNEYDSLRPSH